MLKILYVSDTLRQRAGITAVIMNYLQYITRDNIKIDLLVYEDSEPAMIQKAQDFGARVFFMPQLGIKSFFAFKVFMETFFSSHHYDILHSHFNQIDAIVFPIARKHGVRHCISHSHNTKLSDSKIRAFRNRLMCWNIARNADTLAACSEVAGRALFGSLFAHSPKKLIIRNGVDVETYKFNPIWRNKLRLEFGLANNELLIGHVGRFFRQKNHRFLIQVFSDLCKRNRYKLIMVGDGPLRVPMQNLVNRMGLANKVIFAGSRSDVPAILSACDVFVFPSLYEGLGLALVEAQISGLPCWASNTIPREVAFTDLIRFLPLSTKSSFWAEAIHSTTFSQRRSRTRDAERAGYNIRGEAQALASYYEACTHCKNRDAPIGHGSQSAILQYDQKEQAT